MEADEPKHASSRVLGSILVVVLAAIAVLIQGVGFFRHGAPIELPSVLRGAHSTTTQNVSDYTLVNNLHHSSPARVLWCGFPLFFGKKNYSITDAIFPEVRNVVQYTEANVDTTQPSDVLFISAGGPCPFRPPALQEHFPGKILYLHGNGKNNFPDAHERLYTLGPQQQNVGDNESSRHSIWTIYGAMHLTTFPLDVQRTIYEPELRVKNNGRYFLLYLASHCVLEREQAFHHLAAIGPAHYGGSCSGDMVDGRAPHNASRTPGQIQGRREWAFNKNIFPDYRFALVMENSNDQGYISEKIINAFLGGTVPIWSGTTEISTIFNDRAFVYYDPQNPQAAMDRVAYLEANRTAYEDVLHEPILANGNRTVQDFFSFQDQVGGGKLKWEIRSKMGY